MKPHLLTTRSSCVSLRLSARSSFPRRLQHARLSTQRRPVECSGTTYKRDVTAAPRFIQHKKEAFVFYRFLSVVYDVIVNPGHWTMDMRTDALVPAQLDSPDLKVRCL